MTLEGLQKRFYRAMLGDNAAMDGLVADNRQLSERQSLSIYRNNMQSAVEWDNDLPPLSDLLAEADKARHCRELSHPAPQSA